MAQLVYDVTVRFCDRYIDRRSRTRDQMVQAARSGVQNIAEGSQASATSKKTEIKLTQVARASLEELKLDYQDFLRQRDLPRLEADHPALVRFKQRRCGSLEEVQDWAAVERLRSSGWEHGQTRTDTDREIGEGQTEKASRVGTVSKVRVRPCLSVIVRVPVTRPATARHAWWPMLRSRC